MTETHHIRMRKCEKNMKIIIFISFLASLQFLDICDGKCFFFFDISCSQSIFLLPNRQHIYKIVSTHRLFIRYESKIFIIYLWQPMKQEKCGTRCLSDIPEFKRLKKLFSSSTGRKCAAISRMGYDGLLEIISISTFINM